MTAPVAGRPVVDEIATRDPDLVSAGGSRTWSLRGRNVVVAVTELHAGDRLVEHDLPDEYLLLVQDGTAVGVEHDGRAAVSVSEPALVVVPAGTSAVCATAAATVVRVFTARYGERTGRAVEAIRVHRLRDVPEEEGRFGRIFRTSSLMVNWFPVHEGPRDPERLSPHSHEDFEQLSVTLVGNYMHHLRVPWTCRMSEWRDDQHAPVGSPSMTLIPPTVVHTTRAVGPGPHTLVDVFAPPRADFLAQGWVLNAGDYPGNRP